jgi:polyhydroxybutyrate depolymerase
MSLALFSLLALAPADHIVVGGERREYIVYAPPSAPRPAPLLIVLHGRGGSGKQIRRYSGFDAEADRLGFVVAYPDGIDGRWSDLRQVTLAPEQRAGGHDDVGFLLALVDALAADGRIDPRRVFLVGHSNGGFLAITMACAHADRVAGIGVVAASMPRAECNLSRPVPAVFFHGTEDTLIPYGGGGVGRGGERGWIRSAEESVAVFADKAGCGPPRKSAPIDRDPKDRTQLVVVERSDCGVPVQHYIGVGANHGWPGRMPRVLRPTMEIDATRTVADLFFK